MRYCVVIEKGETSYGAYVSDLPGCVAVAESLEDVINLIKEAIAFHIEGLQVVRCVRAECDDNKLRISP